MTDLEASLLQELYDRRDSSALSLGDLEIRTGIDPRNLRNALENLKDHNWVLEEYDQYFISEPGIQEARSRWA